MSEQITELAVELLLPAEDNPRRKVETTGEEWKGFLSSVKENGVLVPLLVTPHQPDSGSTAYLIVAGHRRWTAAKMAELQTVPVHVRTMTDEERLTTMLVENLQRQDLDPVEEATGFFRLIELGMTQKDLAKAVGRSPKLVAARLRLLELPAKALAAVKSNKITLEAAEQLTTVADDKEVVELALENLQQRSWDPERVVASTKAGIESGRAAEALEKKLADKGITVLEETPEDGKRVEQILVGADIAAHAKEPCHAVVLQTQWSGKVDQLPVCLEPARHNKTGDSLLKRPGKANQTPGQAKEAERRRAEREAKKVRLEQSAAAVKRPPKESTDLILINVITGASSEVNKSAARLCSLDFDPKDYFGAGAALLQFARESGPNLKKAALAVTLSRMEGTSSAEYEQFLKGQEATKK